VAKCLAGYQVGNKTFKVHLDGYNLMPFFKGEVKESPRKGFLYWSDDGDVFAIRVGRRYRKQPKIDALRQYKEEILKAHRGGVSRKSDFSCDTSNRETASVFKGLIRCRDWRAASSGPTVIMGTAFRLLR